jgi:hypothetical protein
MALVSVSPRAQADDEIWPVNIQGAMNGRDSIVSCPSLSLELIFYRELGTKCNGLNDIFTLVVLCSMVRYVHVSKWSVRGRMEGRGH